MEEGLYSIGEVSKIKEITVKTLRYYHKIGILIPKFIDENTGYRYYSIDQFIYIDIIKGFRALGTSIVELQEIFGECDMDKLLDFLDEKRYEAEENINKMKNIISNIDALTKGIRVSRGLVQNNEINIKIFEERKIVTVPCKEVGGLKELLYYSNLDKIIKEQNIKQTMERGTIYRLNKDSTLESMYVFNTIEEENLISSSNIMILPKGKYLTLIYNSENASECGKKMLGFINENKLKPEEWIEIELFNNIFETELYNCQIQVLVERM